MDLPPRLGGQAEGDADEHEDEAGEGVGEAAVELDAVGAGLFGGEVASGGPEGAAWRRLRGWRGESSAQGEGADAGESEKGVRLPEAPFWMGRSVEPKVEMLYWLGSVGEIWCWPPSRSRSMCNVWLPGAAVTRASSAVVILGAAAG